jgi:flagellar hook assembly protein FlgD
LINGDTLKVSYTIKTDEYPGNNTIYLSFNPDNDQAEQYFFNNFLYKNVYVKPDNYNPLLDVTFDGVHILNNDIVSAKPHILINLKDDNRFLALDDTSLIKVQVKYPNGILRTFSFNNDTLRFSPPSLNNPGADNTAVIDFNPSFLEDGDYDLLVSGKDKSGNSAGTSSYKVSFNIINKPMISNLFNYPNPFTTSTAFVFTLTGSEIPQNLRIQILTITGKIVKEITKDELGTIRIGRNITDYKWDGTDQFGQKLANGVYLYRVITNLNGKSLDKYKVEGDTTDKYFNKGYGKMYLMR